MTQLFAAVQAQGVERCHVVGIHHNMKLWYCITVLGFGTICLLDSTKSNATFQKLHVFIPSFKKRGDAPIQLSPLERFTASRTWGCEYTLPDLHNSYTPEGPTQARTEYTYGQLYTQEKSKSKSKLHCILISHSMNPLPIAQPQQLQTHHIAKKGLLPPPPCLW